MTTEKVRIEIEVEDADGVRVADVEGGSVAAVLAEARKLTGIDGVHVFERDRDEPIGPEIEKKKALSLHAHRCHRVHVAVRYDHRTLEHKFSPAATVFRVLQWAIGKHGFNLDDTAKSKARLMLPGASEPLPNDTLVGRLVKHRDCSLTLDLTLKDFTNG